MVEKFKNFLAEEVQKVFSDSDYETNEDCGNYVGFLQEVCFILFQLWSHLSTSIVGSHIRV